MGLLLKLGWRNIWRNKRRSIITILAVMFAVMLSIVMRGIQLGTYEVNIKHVVDLFSGYVQIQVPGYQKNPQIQMSFAFTDSLHRLLRQNPRIVSASPRVVGDGLVSFGENSQGAIIFGVDPEAEEEVSKIPTRIVRGNFLKSEDMNGIVVGEHLLENLNVQIGDEIVILAQGFDGSLGNLKFKIIGAVKTGIPEFDRSSIFMTLTAAQDLLAMEGRVNLVAIRLSDLDDIQPVKEKLNQSIKHSGLVALAWNQVMPDFEQSIKLDNISGILMLAILIVVVAFGIMNTVLMAVTERFREFGIVLSMGMSSKRIVYLVFIETMFIVIIGLVLGNLLAGGINYYIMENPIVFGGEYEQIYAEYGFLPRIESTIRISSFLNTTLSILGISVLATVYPIVKVLRLEPLKGIRYT